MEIERTPEEIAEFCNKNVSNLRKAYRDSLNKIGTDDEVSDDFIKLVIGQKDAYLQLLDFMKGEVDMPEDYEDGD